MKRFIIAALLSLSIFSPTVAQPGIKAANLSPDASQRNFVNLAAAKALGTGPLINLRNGEVFHIDGLGTYYWRASSTTTGDDDTVIQLTNYATGRLHKIAGLTAGTNDGKLLTGQYDAGTGSLPAANAGDWFEVGTTGTIGGQAFVDGEWWQALNDVASGNTAPIVASWTRRRLSPTVAGSVANDTELRALAATTIGQVVYLQGHASAGDHPTIQMVDVGTGGVDDGGATIVSTAGRTYELSPAYRLFPEYYGATYYASDTACEAGSNNDGPLLQAFSDALATGKWEGDSNKGFIRTTQQINFEMRSKYRGQAQFYFPISYDGIGVRIFSNNDAYQRSPERRLLIRAWHGRNTPQDAHWVGKDYAATWDRGIVNGGGQEVQETLLNETSVGVLIDAVKYATLDIEQQGFCVGVSLDSRTNSPNNENAWNDIRVLSSLISKFPVALISRSGSNQWCSQNTIWTGPLLRSGTTAGQSVYGVCLVHDGTASAGSLSGNRISTGGIEATIDGGDELAQVYLYGGENTTLHVRTDLTSVHYTAKFYEHSNRLDSARDNVVYTERKGLVQNNGYANFVNLTGALPHIGAVADYTDLYERVYYSTGTGAGTRASVRGLRLSESLVRTAPVSASGVHVESADKTVNVNFANRLAQVVRMNTSESKEDLLELLIETKNETDVRFVIFPRDANGNDITSNLQPDGTETIRSTDQAISFSGNQFFAGGNVGTTRKRLGFHPNVAEATIAVHGDSISGVIYRWLNSAGSFTIDKDELPIVQGSPVRGEFVDPAIVLSYDANGTEILRLKTTGDSASARPFSTGMSLFHSEWVVVNQGTGNERYWELVTDGDANGQASGTDLAAHVPSAVGDTFVDNSTDVWKYVTTVQKLSSWEGDPINGGGVVDVVRFDTVADMVASTIGTDVKDGDIAITKGYSAEGDLGANTYRYRIPTGAPGAEDGGFIIDHAVNGQFIALDQTEVNVDKFGALGNNTDDQPVIQAALAVAKASGVNVQLGPKTYRLNSSLTIPEDVSIFGMGASQDSTKAVTRLNFTPTGASSCLVFPDTGNYRRNRELRDFSILAGNTNCQSGIVLNRPRDLDVRNVDILGTAINKWAAAALQMQGTIACTFENMTITHSNLAAIQINGNSNTTTNFKRVYGTLCDHYAFVQNCFMATFQECIAESLTTAGIDIARGSRVNAINCHFENVPLSNAVAGHAFDVGTSAGTRTAATELKTILHVSGGLYEGTNVAGGGPNANTTFVQGLSSDEIVIEDVSVDKFGRLFGLSTVHTKSLVARNVTTKNVKGTWPSTVAASNDLEINGFKSSGITSIRDRVDWVAGRSYQSGDIALLTPDWTASRVYAANEFGINPNDNTTIQRITAGTSAATFAEDAASWRTMLTPNYFNAYEIQTNHTSDADFEVDFAAGRVAYVDRDVYYAQMAAGGAADTHQSTYANNELTFNAVGDATESRTLSTEISSTNFTMDTTTGTAGTSIGQYGFTNPIPRQGQFLVEIVVGTGVARFELNDENGNAIRYDVNKATGATTTSIVGGAATTTVPYEQVRGGRIVITAGYNFTEQSKNSGSIRVSPNTSGAGSVIWDFTIKGYYQPDNGTSTQIDLAKYQDFYLGVDIDTDTINSLEFINAREGQSGFIVWQYGDPGSATWTNADFYSVGPPDLSSQTTSDFGSATYIVENGVVRITYIEP